MTSNATNDMAVSHICNKTNNDNDGWMLPFIMDENYITHATEDGTCYTSGGTSTVGGTSDNGTSTVGGGGTLDDGETGGIKDDWTLVDAVEEEDKVAGH